MADKVLEPFTRHPLGLPAGSIRALLALMITGLFAVLVALPADRNVEVPMFLYPLLSLLLVFTVSHGRTIGEPTGAHPLHLPRGTIRFVLLALVAAGVGWQYYADRALLLQRLTPTPEQLWQWPGLLAALGGGFLVGRFLRAGPWRDTAAFQDLMAWVSLLCMIGLAVETLAVIFIHPTIPEGLNLRVLELGLTAAVALYFGARS